MLLFILKSILISISDAACHPLLSSLHQFYLTYTYIRDLSHWTWLLCVSILSIFNQFGLILLSLGVHVSLDLFDSMPDTSFTKADPAPSVDLFTAGTLLCHLLCLRSHILSCHVCWSALSSTLFRENIKKEMNVLPYSQMKATELSGVFTTLFLHPFPLQHALCALRLHQINVHHKESPSVCVVDFKPHLHLALCSRCVQLLCPHPPLHTPTQNRHGSCHAPVRWWVTCVTACLSHLCLPLLMNGSSVKRSRI